MLPTQCSKCNHLLMHTYLHLYVISIIQIIFLQQIKAPCARLQVSAGQVQAVADCLHKPHP